MHSLKFSSYGNSGLLLPVLLSILMMKSCTSRRSFENKETRSFSAGWSQSCDPNKSPQKALKRAFSAGLCALIVSLQVPDSSLADVHYDDGIYSPVFNSECINPEFFENVSYSQEYANEIWKKSDSDRLEFRVPCELPSKIRLQDTSKPSKSVSLAKLRAARILMSHAAFVGQFLPRKSLSVPAKYLYHFLEGTGKDLELNETELRVQIEELFFKEWNAAGKAAAGRMFFDYWDFGEGSGNGGKKDYQLPSLRNTIGRFFLYYNVITKGDKKIIEFGVNDLYTWPEKNYGLIAVRKVGDAYFDDYDRKYEKAFETEDGKMYADNWDFPWDQAPDIRLAKTLQWIFKDESLNYVQNDATRGWVISDRLWRDLSATGVGAKDFRLEGCWKKEITGLEIEGANLNLNDDKIDEINNKKDSLRRAPVSPPKCFLSSKN
jgi:hypothetical protein